MAAGSRLDGPSTDAAARCTSALRLKQAAGLAITAANYEAAAGAWAASRAPNAAEAIEALLADMSQRSGLRPTQGCYDELVTALAGEYTSAERDAIPGLLSQVVARMEAGAERRQGEGGG